MLFCMQLIWSIELKIKEFLDNKDVNSFIKWIGSYLDNEDSLKYGDKDIDESWRFNSIYNAYKKYYWNNKYFKANQKDLDKYNKELNNALSCKEDDDEVKKVCNRILEWGKVTARNKKFIEKSKYLTQELLNIKAIIDPNTFEINKNRLIKIKTNSGFIKIYSVLNNNIIIYDSRVSSAICFFIREFCSEMDHKPIPDVLKFGLARERKEDTDRRNLNNDVYKFTKTKYDDDYLNNAIKASWLLKGILEKTDSNFNTEVQENERLRALESAFFMIGYDLTNISIRKISK